jgi:hypothetical protein
METTISYYSATGNSLAFARAISKEIGGALIVPLANFRETPTRPGTPRVGIIFPIIAWGPPRTVTEFISRIDLQGVRTTAQRGSRREQFLPPNRLKQVCSRSFQGANR